MQRIFEIKIYPNKIWYIYTCSVNVTLRDRVVHVQASVNTARLITLLIENLVGNFSEIKLIL